MPGLPRFKNPPVTEVALSVQFNRLVGFRATHYGLLWEKFRAHFPKTEEHEPIADLIERTDRFQAARQSVQVEMLRSFPLPRVWFLNEGGNQLVQFQPTRLVHNWRQIPGQEQEYPAYDNLRPAFLSALQTVRTFLEELGIGPLVANQCEVTYVNHIVASDEEQLPGLEKITPLWTGKYSEPFLPVPEDIRFATRYPIEVDGKIRGRLHVTAEPRFRIHDKKLIYVLTLIARGEPQGQSDDDILEFLNLGHDWIVRGFASITTRDMHQQWGRYDK